MFQSFDSAGDPTVGKPRVALLRQWLKENGLDGFVVPRADEHQGEYVPPRSNRLRWLTGFSGSAGVAIVLARSAHIFVGIKLAGGDAEKHEIIETLRANGLAVTDMTDNEVAKLHARHMVGGRVSGLLD